MEDHKYENIDVIQVMDVTVKCGKHKNGVSGLCGLPTLPLPTRNGLAGRKAGITPISPCQPRMEPRPRVQVTA